MNKKEAQPSPAWLPAKEFILAVFTKAGEDNLPRLASSFSFFGLLSLAPFLVLAVSIAAIFLGRSEAADHIVNQAHQIGGHQVSEFLRSIIQSSQHRSTGIVATVLSLVVTFFSASNLFINLDDGINYIWRIKSSASMVKGFFVTRLIAFVSVIIFGGILLGWLLLDALLGILSKQNTSFPAWEAVSFLATIAFFTFGFSLSLHALPRKRLAWKDAVPGGFVTALGFGISKFLLAIYFEKLSGVYSAAGGVVVLLLWMYYSSIIYFFGVEVTYLYSHRYGSLKNEPNLVDHPAQPAAPAT